MAVGPVITMGLKYTPSLILTLGYRRPVGPPVFPDPRDVLLGVVYGPTGGEYTGKLSIVLDIDTGRLVKILGRSVGISL